MRKASSTVVGGGRDRVVRLPRAVAFPDGVREVDIMKIGHCRLVVPREARWDYLFLCGPRATDDFINNRDQPLSQERNAAP